jgi:hypothetical protein
VKIDGEFLRQTEDIAWNYEIIADAEEIIERSSAQMPMQVAGRVVKRYAFRRGPGGDLRIGRYEADDRMPLAESDVGADERQPSAACYDAVKCLH